MGESGVALTGFKARNHPQQTRKRGADPTVDDRATTPELFRHLHQRFRFTIDVAALPHNAKCQRYFTPEQNGLLQPWAGERVWCNPPYSSIEPWLEKAWLEWQAASQPELIVMLLPANRTEQGWWQRHVEPHRDRGRDLRVEFLPGRPRFICVGETKVLPNQRPPFGCCLLIWRRPPADSSSACKESCDRGARTGSP
jgi:phage N-6-adenine-methyltransferase